MLNSSLIFRKTSGWFSNLRRASVLTGLRTNPVIVSSHKDIYTNLALEQWLYANLKFTKSNEVATPEHNLFSTPVVLLWVDEPCVVIGRHQNPWTEATVGFLNKAGLNLARRHSGGGCVYHDDCNINISIIGPREQFEKRQDNLKFLAQFLYNSYEIKCEPNKRHDLVYSKTGAKVSGSAARLGRLNSFHHFTLLVDTDKEILHTAIRSQPQPFISSNSSQSVRSNIVNLREIRNDLTIERVLGDLAAAYSKHYGSNKKAEMFEKVTGEPEQFKSLDDLRKSLVSWDWIYGMTPRFKLEKVVNLLIKGKETPIKLIVQVERGLFKSVDIVGKGIECEGFASKFNPIIGTKFTYHDAMVNVAQLLKVDESDRIGLDKLFATYLMQMIHDCNFLPSNKQAQ